MSIAQVITKGTRKTAISKCVCSESNEFQLMVDNMTLDVHHDNFLVAKIKEIMKIIGYEHLENLKFELTTRGGGPISRAYAIRQAFAKAVISYFGKYYDEQRKQDIKEQIMKFDRAALVADPRRVEPKKYGGPAARAKYTKSYR
ncbi:40S ribosomal protein S16 [Spraguea lophii 42_110]|uniref:40S ribosomal protein S16 n=1 Tax=Spraguea lophii (strain 42_110) TaxID=1358809 RepID=S7WDU9_SPRLO|nr:Chain SQ0, 40S ribosomal protein S16 [Spraguea lophii 42_110]7QJH_RQ0 Chain RQ0, 40S ribosomal protein S16 [Spraguea lophii 42_110]7QJH_SQ0 Chain SQ0, 40S ribosomal protein S16 [Spraguea lophii 42_110]8BR3_SQ0 Chain SQ0, 40S ribosomal protein S16 [Spraguea lophii 42_110]8P5D_SQ0 Chain SQ0, 40S ribosomal protein S16 [Spraguea lophii 42_110]8P60_RQ0 Chain RQ0, 40S ribosomal protein S16 [Spraguea lophii 42_110]8P60_SQ0 Chain SQ0, 40S ribosomal protein S16 [Spraguea lophii 42_110]EPR79952.1 4